MTTQQAEKMDEQQLMEIAIAMMIIAVVSMGGLLVCLITKASSRHMRLDPKVTADFASPLFPSMILSFARIVTATLRMRLRNCCSHIVATPCAVPDSIGGDVCSLQCEQQFK